MMITLLEITLLEFNMVSLKICICSFLQLKCPSVTFYPLTQSNSETYAENASKNIFGLNWLLVLAVSLKNTSESLTKHAVHTSKTQMAKEKLNKTSRSVDYHNYRKRSCLLEVCKLHVLLICYFNVKANISLIPKFRIAA